MTREEAVNKLMELGLEGDYEMAHSDADQVLCELLVSLGFNDVVIAWNMVGKWYA